MRIVWCHFEHFCSCSLQTPQRIRQFSVFFVNLIIFCGRFNWINCIFGIKNICYRWKKLISWKKYENNMKILLKFELKLQSSLMLCVNLFQVHTKRQSNWYLDIAAIECRRRPSPWIYWCAPFINLIIDIKININFKIIVCDYKQSQTREKWENFSRLVCLWQRSTATIRLRTQHRQICIRQAIPKCVRRCQPTHISRYWHRHHRPCQSSHKRNTAIIGQSFKRVTIQLWTIQIYWIVVRLHWMTSAAKKVCIQRLHHNERKKCAANSIDH